MSARWLWLPLLSLAGCAVTPAPTPDARAQLDAIARDYVQLTLEIGEREPGYVDAYYGPPEWAAMAKANPRALAALRAETDRLLQRVATIPVESLDGLEQRRPAFLAAQLKAAQTRLRMLQGEKLRFADEAEGLFAWRPQLKPLADYDAALAEAFLRLAGDPGLRERLGAAARRRIEGPFHISHTIRKTLELYEALRGSSAPRQ